MMLAGVPKSGDAGWPMTTPRVALLLAGSETQVMSLWPVSDQGTRELMTGYYQGLQRGVGRSAALRQVQLRMLTEGNITGGFRKGWYPFNEAHS